MSAISDDQRYRQWLLNPFGPQPLPAGVIDAAMYHGAYSTAVGRVAGFDGRVSREIGDWFGAGPVGLALGGEYRKRNSTRTSSSLPVTSRASASTRPAASRVTAA
jgi:hypothetical protein